MKNYEVQGVLRLNGYLYISKTLWAGMIWDDNLFKEFRYGSEDECV
jgi:hypothetical protein